MKKKRVEKFQGAGENHKSRTLTGVLCTLLLPFPGLLCLLDQLLALMDGMVLLFLVLGFLQRTLMRNTIEYSSKKSGIASNLGKDGNKSFSVIP